MGILELPVLYDEDEIIEINAPKYMINHGGITEIRKRKEYNKYQWRKINEH